MGTKFGSHVSSVYPETSCDCDPLWSKNEALSNSLGCLRLMLKPPLASQEIPPRNQ